MALLYSGQRLPGFGLGALFGRHGSRDRNGKVAPGADGGDGEKEDNGRAESPAGASPARAASPASPASPAGTASPRGRFGTLLSVPFALAARIADSMRGADADAVERERALEERKTIVRLQMRSATAFDDWRTAAAELDELEANNPWKDEDPSDEYNYALVQHRLRELEAARIAGDAHRMAFLVRTALARHLGGMGSVRLYKHSHVGTKRLVERYIATALATIDALLERAAQQQYAPPPLGLDARLVLEHVLAARQAFGRSALLLSGGGTFGMSHIGVVKSLWEQQLLPRIISGASAGSIVCSVLCVKTDDELPSMLEDFFQGDLDVFTGAADHETMLTLLARFLKIGALFDVDNLTRVMRGMLGDLTFQEAYNRTRRILNITVSSASLFELPRLLNYITAPNVLIWSAVAASCSVPGIFSPAGLLAKDPRSGAALPWDPSPQRWIDGSVDNDLPMTRLAEMFNVNHFIVSQVNPHVTPFLAEKEQTLAAEARAAEAGSAGPGWTATLTTLAKDEVMHRMQVLAELGVFPNVLTKTRSVLSQKYSGDITILPEVSFSQLYKVLVNPTPEFMLQSMLHGERATWPRLDRIRNDLAIELALDDAVQRLRARIAFSPSQVDLRLAGLAPKHARARSDSGGKAHHRAGGSRRANGAAHADPHAPRRPARQVRANTSRPVSTVSTASAGAALGGDDADAFSSGPSSSATDSRRTLASPFKLSLGGARQRSPPIFSTGSEADSDEDSRTSESESDDDAALFSPRHGDDYFGPAADGSPHHSPSPPRAPTRTYSMPDRSTPHHLSLSQPGPHGSHGSQPATPAGSEGPARGDAARSSLSNRPPTPVATPPGGPALPSLAMTPRQDQPPELRTPSNTPAANFATPPMASPPAQGARRSGDVGALRRRLSLTSAAGPPATPGTPGPAASLAPDARPPTPGAHAAHAGHASHLAPSPRSSLDLPDISGTRGMLRRKKSHLKARALTVQSQAAALLKGPGHGQDSD